MATYDYNSVQQQEKIDTLKYNARKVSRMKNVAQLRVRFDGTEVATNTVHLWSPQTDIRIHNVGVKGASSATLTVDIGTGTEPDAIVDGLVCPVDAFTTGGDFHYQVQKGEDLVLTYDAVSPVADEDYVVVIEYSNNT